MGSSWSSDATSLVATMDVIRLEDFEKVQATYKETLDSINETALELKRQLDQAQLALGETRAVVQQHSEEIALLKSQVLPIPRVEADIVSIKAEIQEMQDKMAMMHDKGGMAVIMSGDARKIEEEVLIRRRNKQQQKKQRVSADAQEGDRIYNARIHAIKMLVHLSVQKEDPQSARKAVLALLSICENPSKRYLVLKCGGLEAGYGSMRGHPKDRTLVAAACSLLQYFLTFPPTMVHCKRSNLVNGGRLSSLLLKVIKGTGNDPACQEAAAAALWPANLLCGSVAQRLCVQEDGFNLLIACAKQYQDNEKVCFRAVGSLLSLMVNNQGTTDMAPLEVATLVKAAMTTHPNIKFDGDFTALLPWVQQSLRKLKAQRKAAKAAAVSA